MKRRFLSVLLILILAFSFSLVTAVPAGAAKGPSLGAVKLPLFEREQGYDSNDPGTGDQAGWAIANTNADGMLIVETHLDSGAPSTAFFVFVKINGTWLQADVGQLTTNRKGKGNAHAELNMADYPSSTGTIDVQVVVRVGPPYLPGYASAHTSVPLKK